MSPKVKDKAVTLIMGDGMGESVEWKTTRGEVDRMFRDSIIQGALASAAIEEGGAVDYEALTTLFDEDVKKHG